MGRNVIYLMRHGQTAWNAEHRYQGWQDSPLTELGRDQARAAGRLLADLVADPASLTVVSSPLNRARNTARLVLSELGLDAAPVWEDSRLTEIRMGVWEGMPEQEVFETYGDLVAVRRADPWTHSPPGGETYASVAERVGTWLAEQSEDATILVVTHGVAGRILHGLYLGLDREQIRALSPFRQDEIHVLTEGLSQTFETMPDI
jgi:broad specificity phosphatase PhoE